MAVSVVKVVEQLRDLGVREGVVLLVHTAFRSVRPVERGPLGLIEALRMAIGDEGTLVMPTMTDGADVFDPRSTPTHGMGIVAELFWQQAGVLRSDHPGGSFAAVGPHAEAICKPQPLSPPHGVDSPVGRVFERSVMIAETDHCCRNFRVLDDWLRSRKLQLEGTVGNAHARLCNARDIVKIVVDQLQCAPLTFLCSPNARCDECDRARASGS